MSGERIPEKEYNRTDIDTDIFIYLNLFFVYRSFSMDPHLPLRT